MPARCSRSHRRPAASPSPAAPRTSRRSTGGSRPISDTAAREVGGYLVEDQIGRGGMAIVHRARQPGLDRDVALKELAGLWATDPTATLRFLREAKLSGSLNHPNIVVVYEYFEDRGIPYIAMEYLPRGSLRPLVGTLSEPQVIRVLDGILRGLAHASEHGIVHRDLKPENVMRTSEGSVKIADFGIATAYDELANANLTPLGEFVGAPGYVAPEQVLGEPATTASDLYSVGVIAFELLAGTVPFGETGTGGGLLVRKVNERAPSLASKRPDLDRRLVEWVDRLLERNLARRPSDPAAVREALEDAADDALGAGWRRVAERPPGDPPSRAVETPAPGPRRRLVHALTRPFNLVVPALVGIAAILLESWLFLVAAAVYVALVAISQFEPALRRRRGIE